MTSSEMERNTTVEQADGAQSAGAEPGTEATPVAAPEDWTDEEWVRAATDSFQQLVAEQPDMLAVIDRVVSRYLQKGVDRATAGALLDALSRVIGVDGASFLLNLLAKWVDDPELGARVLDRLEPQVASMAQAMFALYGADIREAAVIAAENPESWRSVNRQVFYDLVSGQWVVRFEIVKYNRETISLEETPSTLLVLAEAVLDTLSYLPHDAIQATLDRPSLETLEAKANELLLEVGETSSPSPSLDTTGDGS